MINYQQIILLAAILFISSCGGSSKVVNDTLPESSVKLLHYSAQHDISQDDSDFAGNARAQRFIDDMVQQGFERQQLNEILSQTKRLDYVIDLMNRQAPVPATTIPSITTTARPNGSWLRYRSKFITDTNVQRGVQFWDQYQQVLERAEKMYGVPASIIVGILGVETRWGQVTGKTRVIDALATLAFSYPRRASYFTKELESFLLMSSQEGIDPLMSTGSFAGAMGYGQFMPGSYRQYAVDFDGDGHTDLWNPVDAIGSVAHYFQQHGWIIGDRIAVPAHGQVHSLPVGINTRYHPVQLTKAGLSPCQSVEQYQQVSLLRLDMGKTYQYWYGLPNFYVITRYNHSTYYAMTVWQLGNAVEKARQNRIQ